MRIKDKSKQEAIILATVKLVNEIGFVSSSVSKIAKLANVSPATLYIYYKNKEDLLISTYIDIKQKLSRAMLDGIDETKPIRDILEEFWHNAFDFIGKNADLFQYAEQFSNSPYSEKVNKSEVEKHFTPLMNILQRGIDEKIIKDVHPEMLAAFMFYPILILSNKRLCTTIDLSESIVNESFKLAWYAIKL